MLPKSLWFCYPVNYGVIGKKYYLKVTMKELAVAIDACTPVNIEAQNHYE